MQRERIPTQYLLRKASIGCKNPEMVRYETARRSVIYRTFLWITFFTATEMCETPMPYSSKSSLAVPVWP